MAETGQKDNLLVGGGEPTITKTENQPQPSVELKPEDAVTPEILSAVLKELNRSELELVDFTAKEGTTTGDNYMSLMFSVQINLKDTNTGNFETIPVMLKVLPRSEFRLKVIQEATLFVRDVNFYQEIIPTMLKFQMDIKLSGDQVVTPWPKCYSCKTDGNNDYLAMKDLKVEGFRMANRQLGLDFDHCKLVMENLARFHALSFAIFQGNYDLLIEKYPYLQENMYKEDKILPAFKEVIEQTYTKQADMLRDVGEELGASLLEKIYANNYFQEMFELVGAKPKWAVIGHGDCWTNNLLFRYDDETNKPIEVKFVDFQLCRAASPAVDIHYFLYSSPQTPVLNEKEAQLEQIYFDEFTRFSNILHVDLKSHGFTKANFDEELERVRYYGVVAGVMLAVVTSAESSDVPDKEWKGEDIVNFMSKGKDKALEKVRNLAGLHLPRCQQVKKYISKN